MAAGAMRQCASVEFAGKLAPASCHVDRTQSQNGVSIPMLAKTESTASTTSASPPISIPPETSELTSDGLVASPFLNAIRAEFIGSGPKPTYPGVPKSEAVGKIIREFPEAMAAMLTVLEDGGLFPANPTPGSALALVMKAAKDGGWPNETTTVPSDWREKSFTKFRRYEIASALNIMMQAYHHSGVAGGTTGFPPEKP
jgi:hypothetical protein